jgi:[ribosomal protein S18]-alanine N-acetyltransferase
MPALRLEQPIHPHPVIPRPSLAITAEMSPIIACLPLIAADIPAVLALDQRCLGGLWTASGYQRELDSDCSDLLVLIAANDEQTLQQRVKWGLAAGDPTQGHHPITLLGVGCLWAILDEAHITTLAIEPTYQGRKLGQWLLSELLSYGHRRGLTHATLEVRVSNQQALGLYQKFDFKEAGQRKRYYSDGENARILWRSGLQHPGFLGQLQHRKEEAIAQLTPHFIYQRTFTATP